MDNPKIYSESKRLACGDGLCRSEERKVLRMAPEFLNEYYLLS